ncbi:NifU family protein [Streptosporangium sp. NBC_01639]|uniref:NifU family protein n=1 Tax=unclassified Streptosporangium TaxID=2632669 RepID=UPI002DD961DF|nr:NifU family protein [Streptosporangium sp. NBC_01756]WSC85912.1 NifU family protein [Streptosporangium sp. NBC_01756]WTD55415.1 NifU family protein [Streptosporangium sp. NBC_01639]
MPHAHDVQAAGNRVEALLAELAAHGDPVARARTEELVRVLVELYGAGLERVVEIVTEAEAAQVLHRLSADDLVSSLLVLHDLHPLTTAERVSGALDTVRPYLGLHEGGVELLGVEADGVVRLRLAGTCHGCPSSQRTATDAIEGAVLRAAPEVSRVVIEGVADDRGPLLQIRHSPPPGPCTLPETLPEKVS